MNTFFEELIEWAKAILLKDGQLQPTFIGQTPLGKTDFYSHSLER